MKAPKYPSKPYPPYKPSPPPELVDLNQNIASVSVDVYSLYTLDSFAEMIKGALKNADPKDVKFEFQVEKEWDYDDCTTTIVANLITQAQIPNPRLAALTKEYEKALEKYHKDMEKHKVDLKKYTEEMATYERDIDAYQLQQAKLRVK